MTFDNNQRSRYGTVALVGSGEYLPVLNDVDLALLKMVEGVHPARVALLPTASGMELMGATYWNDLGVKHFKHLGVSDVRATRIIDRVSANDAAQVALLEGVDLFYFSGGDPHYLIDTLRDSLAWRRIHTAYERGAVLVGCSAGAIMLSGYTISLRQAMMGHPPAFVAALGIVPYLIVIPHFDRVAGFFNHERFQQWVRTIPPGYAIVGIDEETALIRVALHVEGSGQDRWRVMGRHTVNIWRGDGQTSVLKSGAEILL